MKRIIALVASILFIGAAATQVHAFGSKTISTNTAAVTLEGGGNVQMTVNIKDAGSHAGAAEVGWTGITPGVTQWDMSDQYLELVSTITAATGGIQIYTDNRGVGADPLFQLGISSNPAGLVHVQNSSDTLRMAWSIKGSTKVLVTEIGAADPNTGPTSGVNNKFQWLFMKDKGTPNIPAEGTTLFVDGEDFVTVKDTRGIHFGQSSLEFGGDSSPDFIYLEANFTTAVTPATYRTKTLRVEGFTE